MQQVNIDSPIVKNRMVNLMKRNLTECLFINIKCHVYLRTISPDEILDETCGEVLRDVSTNVDKFDTFFVEGTPQQKVLLTPHHEIYVDIFFIFISFLCFISKLEV